MRTVEVISTNPETTKAMIAAMAKQGIHAIDGDAPREEIELDPYIQEMKEDEKRIGTPEYRGIAYFWSYEYRHYLRNCGDQRRREIHAEFMAAGLPLDGESEQHEEIIMRHHLVLEPYSEKHYLDFPPPLRDFPDLGPEPRCAFTKKIRIAEEGNVVTATELDDSGAIACMWQGAGDPDKPGTTAERIVAAINGGATATEAMDAEGIPNAFDMFNLMTQGDETD